MGGLLFLSLLPVFIYYYKTKHLSQELDWQTNIKLGCPHIKEISMLYKGSLKHCSFLGFILGAVCSVLKNDIYF